MGIYALPWPLPAVPRVAGQGQWHWPGGSPITSSTHSGRAQLHPLLQLTAPHGGTADGLAQREGR